MFASALCHAGAYCDSVCVRVRACAWVVLCAFCGACVLGALVLCARVCMTAQAVRLARQCIDFAHCTFGCGFGGALLAYCLANGGKTYRVMNGFGMGGPLSDLQCLAPPPPAGPCVAHPIPQGEGGVCEGGNGGLSSLPAPFLCPLPLPPSSAPLPIPCPFPPACACSPLPMCPCPSC